MSDLMFRDLNANEIECRVGMQRDKGLTLLLYKDARCDMAILDEAVGVENWQREHYECKGNLFCRVGICYGSNDAPRWVWKSDCGTESNTEKEKGEASDSFKRACVNWGIGRELYTAPFIWIAATDKNGDANYKLNEKGKCNDDFIVEKIVIENKKITAIAIRNATLNKRVYIYQKPVSLTA